VKLRSVTQNVVLQNAEIVYGICGVLAQLI